MGISAFADASLWYAHLSESTFLSFQPAARQGVLVYHSEHYAFHFCDAGSVDFTHAKNGHHQRFGT